ncbi:hypothetical protein [Terribacillus saccharophilus]|uniref:hypothetical protein n=1 Tax=Terribacillus saccharophilus TaxID=361277 RepID=UPI002989C906|nr:hypothetical protein [Terribacillus saccharophilus]MCM3227525.1 hypothetical protein [Terribacillus saccharophilus]
MRTNANPLLKIIGTILVKISPDSTVKLKKEVYECGHYAEPKQDIIGEYAAVKRRCHKCKLEKPAQLSSSEIERVKKGEVLVKVEE